VQTAFLIIVSVSVMVVTVALVVLVRGLLCEIRKIGKAGEDLSRVADSIDREIVPAIKDARATMANTDILVRSATQAIKRIDGIADGLDHLVHNNIAGAIAAKAVKSSATSLLSVYEGVRKGIKTLRDSKDTQGGNSDEQ